MDADRIITPDEAAIIQAETIDRGDLLVWTVAAHPSDYPDAFTARPHSSRLNRFYPYLLCAPTLDALREALPYGLTRINRAPTDDPVIVETWL